VSPCAAWVAVGRPGWSLRLPNKVMADNSAGSRCCGGLLERCRQSQTGRPAWCLCTDSDLLRERPEGLGFPVLMKQPASCSFRQRPRLASVVEALMGPGPQKPRARAAVGPADPPAR